MKFVSIPYNDFIYEIFIYEMLCEIFVRAGPDATGANITEFPRANTPELLTKERIAAKLKRVRTGYKKAVDAGRRSGGGRVVLTFYDLCENVWGGSPAVESISGGIDTSAQENHTSVTSDSSLDRQDSVSPDPSVTSNSSFFGDVNEGESSLDSPLLPGEDEESDLNQPLAAPCSSKDRRAKISKFLTDRKDAKMNKKLNCETQMLNCTKEDLQLKRKISDGMDKSDAELSETMNKVHKTMESIGDSIKQGFTLMADVLKQTQAPVTDSFPSLYANYHFPASQATQNLPNNYFGQPRQVAQQYSQPQQYSRPKQYSQPQNIPFCNISNDETPQS